MIAFAAEEVKPWMGKPWPESIRAAIDHFGGRASFANRLSIKWREADHWYRTGSKARHKYRELLSKELGFGKYELPDDPNSFTGVPCGWPTELDKAILRGLDRWGAMFAVSNTPEGATREERDEAEGRILAHTERVANESRMYSEDDDEMDADILNNRKNQIAFMAITI